MSGATSQASNDQGRVAVVVTRNARRTLTRIVGLVAVTLAWAASFSAQSRTSAPTFTARVTAVIDGDTIDVLTAEKRTVRIRLEGNISAEFIGAAAGGPNTPAEARNLPGVLNGQDMFGGLGGPGGIDIIGPVGGITNNINAIAADSVGRMFALELQEVPIPNPPQGGPDTRNLVYVVELTFPPTQPPSFPLPNPYGPGPYPIRQVDVQSTIIAEISDEIIAQSGGVFPTVNTVPAADFHPSNGLLYFGATGADGNFDKLFTVDVNAGGPGPVAASVNGIPGFFNDPGEDGITVASIAFDQVPGGTQLVALIGDDEGGGGGAGAGMFLWGTALIVIQSGSEEVFFRGWIQPILVKAWGFAGILTTAATFAALHLIGGAISVVSVLNMFLGGVLFGLLAARYGGIAVAVAAHFAWNWAEQLLFGLYPNPGIGSFGSILNFDLVGSSWWGGSDEGLNASIATTFALAILLAPYLIVPARDSQPPGLYRSDRAPA